MFDFYIHFDLFTLKITTITSNADIEDGQHFVKVSHEVGLKFLTGEENPINWCIIPDGKEYRLDKAKLEEIKLHRIDVGLGIYEVKQNDWDDVRIVIKDDFVEIHYDGDKLKEAKAPVKMYFTREGDMSYLKMAFSLDVNILNKIIQDNNLISWPNPIRVSMKDVDDLSIYAVKGPLTVSITNG